MVAAWSDPELAADAESALRRIEGALPEALLGAAAATALHAPDFHVPEAARRWLPELRRALEGQRKVRCVYRRADGRRTTRVLWPLGLFFWGQGWSLAAWCELRRAFRHFRLDRMSRCRVLDEAFAQEPGRRLEDFLATTAG
jgi:predicted DNA-binding transcriptional regulator YafY